MVFANLVRILNEHTRIIFIGVAAQMLPSPPRHVLIFAQAVSSADATFKALH